MYSNKTVKTDDLRLARIQYWDINRHAAEIPDIDAYVLLINVDGKYINLFDATKVFPVYERSNVVNVRAEDELEYGNKLVLVDGEEKEGLCYVIEKLNLRNVFGNEILYIDEIINYIVRSQKFFIDRINILKTYISNHSRRGAYIREIIKEDSIKLDKFNKYINSHDPDAKIFCKY